MAEFSREEPLGPKDEAPEQGPGWARSPSAKGVFGLRRAFVLAGANALVMSLWKVPDLATAFLMDRFDHTSWRAA